MIRRPLREPVRVLFHLNGLTQVLLERIEGVGLADRFTWDIPTEAIPPHLRAIGSRFVVAAESVTPEAHDTVDELRAARSIRVEELDSHV
jgi:hypothetical protein